MKTKLICLAAFLLSWDVAVAQYLWVNLSFKAVLNPTNGSRYYNFTEANIDRTIGHVNEILATYQRGYRFRRAELIRNVGGINQTNGPSKWYSVNPRANDLATGAWDNRKQMEIEALNAPVPYAWNFGAINYYITAGYGAAPQDAGDCAFPTGNNHLIVLGTVDNPYVLLHETGHYFELYHTQGSCDCIHANQGCISTNGYWVGNDDVPGYIISDTIFDSECLTINGVAQANYNRVLMFLTPPELKLVEDTFYNNMSYHPGTNQVRLTELQLHKWTDFANSARLPVMSGRTRFVSTLGVNSGQGTSSTAPVRTVVYAAGVATAEQDILLLRPGSYNEQFTINKALTLRATRNGWATIGKP
jgi:hypothetical protein